MRPKSSRMSSPWLPRALAVLGAAALVAASVPKSFAEPPKPAPAESAPHPAGPFLTGFWTAYNDDGKPGAVFYFYEKNGLYEGRLVKEITYPGDPPEDPLCTHCPGDKKNKPMLGLVIVWGMKKHGAAKYESGHILDPRDGSVWSAELEVTPDNKKLNLRGYVATPLPDDTMAPTDIPGDPIPGLASAEGKKAGGHAAPAGGHAPAAPHPARE